MRILTPENDKHRPYHDGEVQPNAPIVNIPEIELNPALHFVQGVRFTSGAAYLRPARYPRFDMMAKSIFLYH